MAGHVTMERAEGEMVKAEEKFRYYGIALRYRTRAFS